MSIKRINDRLDRRKQVKGDDVVELGKEVKRVTDRLQRQIDGTETRTARSATQKRRYRKM